MSQLLKTKNQWVVFIILKLKPSHMSSDSKINTSNKKETIVVQNNKTTEAIWRFLLIVVTFITCFVARKIYIYQTNLHFDSVRMGNLSELLIHCIPIAVIFTLIDRLIHSFGDNLCMKYFMNHEKYSDPNILKKRCFSAVKLMISVVVYSAFTVLGFYSLAKANMTPSQFGGPINTYEYTSYKGHFPVQNAQPMRILLYLQLGKMLSKLFTHVFIYSEGNHYEFFLHHTMSVIMVGFGFLASLWWFTVYGLLLHDASDMMISTCRLVREYKKSPKMVTYATMFIAMSVWLFTRLYVFPFDVIIPCARKLLEMQVEQYTQFQIEVLAPFCWFNTSMMGLLVVMHIYWTYFLFKSIYSSHIAKSQKQVQYG